MVLNALQTKKEHAALKKRNTGIPAISFMLQIKQQTKEEYARKTGAQGNRAQPTTITEFDETLVSRF